MGIFADYQRDMDWFKQDTLAVRLNRLMAREQRPDGSARKKARLERLNARTRPGKPFRQRRA